MQDVQRFMAHHVYSVWDFMSLLKTLQQRIAPASSPWTPVGGATVRRFINEIVLEEESDEGLPDANGDKTYASHFELYCQAMNEVGADPAGALEFVEIAPYPRDRRRTRHGDRADARAAVHADHLRFHRHRQAARRGRCLRARARTDHSGDVPRVAQENANRQNRSAGVPLLSERHIHLDENHHGPLSLLMLNELCAGDETRLKEAEEAAHRAIEARIAFWDGVLEALEQNQPPGHLRLSARR